MQVPDRVGAGGVRVNLSLEHRQERVGVVHDAQRAFELFVGE